MSATIRIVSLASEIGRFTRGLVRLEASLTAVGYRGETDLRGPGRFPRGCPSQRESPFAFKPFCLREAERQGATIVLWLDSSCVAVASLDPILRRIETDGYVLFRNGRYRVGEWVSDVALEALAMSREAAMEIPDVNAAAVGLNLRHDLGRAFLDGWLEHARRGVVFRGVERPLADDEEHRNIKWNRGGCVSRDPRVRGHRHDQAAAGVLAFRLGLELQERGLCRYDAVRGIDAATRIANDRRLELTVDAVESARRRGRRIWGRAIRGVLDLGRRVSAVES